MIMDLLKHAGTTEWARDIEKIEVSTGASSAQDFKSRPGIPSGPAAFLLFTCFRTLLTSCSDTEEKQYPPGQAILLASVFAEEPKSQSVQRT